MNNKVVLAIPQLTGGGAERVVSVWANELTEKNYEVVVILCTRFVNEYYTNPKVRIISIADTIDEYLKLSYICRISKMRALLKEIKPGYIISFLPAMQVWMMFASIGLGIKRFETIRVNPWRISVTNPLNRFLWKCAYYSAEKIIIQASDQLDWFSKHDRHKCVLIPNPISEVYINNYKTNFADGAAINFIAAGRICEQKNYKMMIDAFHKLCIDSHDSDFKLKIFGSGSEVYMKELKDYIEKLGMNDSIRFMGRSTKMEDEYKENDIFLMTSDYEGLPNALMEAMASKLVCISTDCKTGPRDLIDDGVNGFLVPVGDYMSLYRVMKNVVTMSKEDRIRISENARLKVINHCSKDNSINRLCEILD